MRSAWNKSKLLGTRSAWDKSKCKSLGMRTALDESKSLGTRVSRLELEPLGTKECHEWATVSATIHLAISLTSLHVCSGVSGFNRSYHCKLGTRLSMEWHRW